MTLSYHNDGKEKQQSHGIYSEDLNHHLNMFLEGYGSTKDEAYDDFISKLFVL